MTQVQTVIIDLSCLEAVLQAAQWHLNNLRGTTPFTVGNMAEAIRHELWSDLHDACNSISDAKKCVTDLGTLAGLEPDGGPVLLEVHLPPVWEGLPLVPTLSLDMLRCVPHGQVP